MSLRLKRKSNTVTISSLNEWRALDKINLEPKYQRKSVWGTEQQSLLIDSILKNIPVPPIFLRESIDVKGRATFEVIDGKQRLTSIFKFIDNELITAEDDNDALHMPELAGLTISDLEDEKFEDLLIEFWAYPIPVEYVYTKDNNTVEKIFDRLNRSGEKLNGQELRNANYYDSKLTTLAYKFTQQGFWKKELMVTNKNRMEDVELMSEFIFLIIEDNELTSSPKALDEMYKKYADSTDLDWVHVEEVLSSVSEYFKTMQVDFVDYNVSGVSHLYGVWAFVYHCVKNDIPSQAVKAKLHEFYQKYKVSSFEENDPFSKYKGSMMNGTKNRMQRKRRKEALIEYCL